MKIAPRCGVNFRLLVPVSMEGAHRVNESDSSTHSRSDQLHVHLTQGDEFLSKIDNGLQISGWCTLPPHRVWMGVPRGTLQTESDAKMLHKQPATKEQLYGQLTQRKTRPNLVDPNTSNHS